MRRLPLLALFLPLSAGLSMPADARPSDLVVSARQTVSAPTQWERCAQSQFDRERFGQATEPAVAVDPRDSQRAAAVWMQDAALAQPVVRTGDAGRRWSAPAAPSLSGCTGRAAAGGAIAVFDPQLAWTGGGALLVSGITAGAPTGVPPETPLGDTPGVAYDPFVREVVVARSGDGGQTFLPPAVLRRTGDTDAAILDRDVLAADVTRPQEAVAAWTRIDVPADTSAVEWSRTTDGGQTWSPALPLVGGRTSARLGVVLTTGIASVGGNAVALVLEAAPQPLGLAGTFVGDSTLAAYGLAAGETSWTRLSTLTVLPGFPQTASLVAGPDGALVAGWADEDRVVVARSTDGGRTWRETTVAVGATSPSGVTVGAASGGRTAVLWYAGPDSSRTVTVAESRDAARSFPRQGTVEDGLDLSRTHATNGAGGSALGDYFGLAHTGKGWLAVYAAPPTPEEEQRGQTGVVRTALVR